MWQSDTDRQEAAEHERQVRSMARMILPMMDVASLVECTPESERRRVAEHGRLVQAMAGHLVSAGERSPAVIIRLAAWVAAQVAGVFRQGESSEVTGRR
jgi:hypothetical protein